MTDIPFNIFHFSSVGSTCDEAKIQLDADMPEGTVILADQQTAGRGRYGRGWISPKGNLYTAVLLRPKVEARIASQLTFAVAIAVRQALKKALGPSADVALKWPNDILINQKKVSGILLEFYPSPSSSKFVDIIVGCGINILHKPPYPSITATTLQEHTFRPPAVKDMLHLYLQELGCVYQQWKIEGFETIRKLWLEGAHRLGQKIPIRTRKKDITGTFLDLGTDGSLIFEDLKGERQSLQSAEVFL